MAPSILLMRGSILGSSAIFELLNGGSSPGDEIGIEALDRPSLVRAL
jgi:hypothetical protein